MKTLLVIPPMSNLRSPYPSTAYLAGYLQARGLDVAQADWSIELILRLLSKPGLERLGFELKHHRSAHQDNSYYQGLLAQLDHYQETVDDVISFLKGSNPALAQQISSRKYLPEGYYLDQLFLKKDKPSWMPQDLEAMEENERARIIATYYLYELCYVVGCLSPGFNLESYTSIESRTFYFDELLFDLELEEDHLIADLIDEMTRDGYSQYQPDIVGVSVPFLGNILGAFLVAQSFKRLNPEIKLVLGGGFANTCLRKLTDQRVFDYIDFITLDDGERPLECLFEFLSGKRGENDLLRTFHRKGGKVIYCSSPDERDIPFAESARPIYKGLNLDQYLAVQTGPGPANRIWSQHWNKMTLAHGCYWGRCSFCDITLDYVSRHETQEVDKLMAYIRETIEETGRTDFHWVDEAVPPKLLRALAERLVEEQVSISWWGNVRFEKAYTPELVGLLAESGCVKISAGLEVAADRLLEMMKKGITVEQVARVAKRFSDNGVVVHAYLIYGFPGETLQETIDSLEMVRQLFAAGCLHSAFWHRFLLTENSGILQKPDEYGIILIEPELEEDFIFSVLERPFEDPTGVDHDALGPGLSAAIAAYQEGRELDKEVIEWFDFTVPAPTVDKRFVDNALMAASQELT